MEHNARKRVGLALGGGAVRGLAHLGVLKTLERAGVRVDCVSGTSVGALVGAAFCAGVGVQRMEGLAAQIGWRNIARPTWPAQGLVSFARLERWLVGLLGDLVFEELAIPLAVMATDLESGRPVVLREERLAAAVRASCAIPGIVTPLRMEGRLLGDGGVTDNLPVAAARDLADFVIGVDVCRPAYRRRWGPWGAGLAALETLVRHAGGGVYEADCLIAPDLAGYSYVRFGQRESLMALGARAAEESLPVIQAALAGQPGDR